jgi:Transposase IS66 family
MFAMTGRSAARIRRRPCSTTLATGLESIRKAILPAMWASCRPIRLMETTSWLKESRAPILEAPCWSHGRRKFFDLAKPGEAPIASEAVRRIDVLFEIERKTPEQRLAVRREKSRPLVADLEIWMRQQRAFLSSNNDTAKAINYSQPLGCVSPASWTIHLTTTLSESQSGLRKYWASR